MKSVKRSNGTTVMVPDEATVYTRPTGHAWDWFDVSRHVTVSLYEETLSCSSSTTCDNCGGAVPHSHETWCPFYGTSSPSHSPPPDTPTVTSDQEVTGETSKPEFDGCTRCNKPWKWSNYSNRWWCVECGDYKAEEKTDV